MGFLAWTRRVVLVGVGYAGGVAHVLRDTRVFAVVRERSSDRPEEALLCGITSSGSGSYVYEAQVVDGVRAMVREENGYCGGARGTRGVFLRVWLSGIKYWVGAPPHSSERLS